MELRHIINDRYQVVNKEGKGAIIFINQHPESINLLTRLSILKENQIEGKLITNGVNTDAVINDHFYLNIILYLYKEMLSIAFYNCPNNDHNSTTVEGNPS